MSPLPVKRRRPRGSDKRPRRSRRVDAEPGDDARKRRLVRRGEVDGDARLDDAAPETTTRFFHRRRGGLSGASPRREAPRRPGAKACVSVERDEEARALRALTSPAEQTIRLSCPRRKRQISISRLACAPTRHSAYSSCCMFWRDKKEKSRRYAARPAPQSPRQRAQGTSCLIPSPPPASRADRRGGRRTRFSPRRGWPERIPQGAMRRVLHRLPT